MTTSMNLRGVGVRILADNIPVLYDFYTQKIGFKVHWGNRDGAYVAFSEAGKDSPAFSVLQKQNMTMYKGYKPLHGSGKTDVAVFTTGLDDVDGYYELLKSRGVDILGEPQNMYDWQYRCFYFRDPEGNLFEVAGALKR